MIIVHFTVVMENTKYVINYQLNDKINNNLYSRDQ